MGLSSGTRNRRGNKTQLERIGDGAKQINDLQAIRDGFNQFFAQLGVLGQVLTNKTIIESQGDNGQQLNFIAVNIRRDVETLENELKVIDDRFNEAKQQIGPNPSLEQVMMTCFSINEDYAEWSQRWQRLVMGGIAQLIATVNSKLNNTTAAQVLAKQSEDNA